MKLIKQHTAIIVLKKLGLRFRIPDSSVPAVTVEVKDALLISAPFL